MWLAWPFPFTVWSGQLGQGVDLGGGQQRPQTETLNSWWPQLPVEADFMPPGENDAVSVDRPFQRY